LLKSGANVFSDKGYKRQTPLHITVEMNNEIAVRLLLDAESKVLARDDDGMTPLDYAESESIVKLLKSYSIIATP
jgi:ankyrin repeat protein